MKLATTAAGAALWALLAASSALAGAGATGQQVTVSVRREAVLPLMTEALAETGASAMFALIGVTIHWRSGAPRNNEKDSIVLAYTDHTPEDELPGALGVALPGEAAHVRIFWDRIRYDPDPTAQAAYPLALLMVLLCTGVELRRADWVRFANCRLERNNCQRINGGGSGSKKILRRLPVARAYFSSVRVEGFVPPPSRRAITA